MIKDAAYIEAFDSNEFILEDMMRKGVDLSVAREIEFAHKFTNVSSAESFLLGMTDLGHGAKLSILEPNNIDVIVTSNLIPEVNAITGLEVSFDKLARQHGGYADGWGFWDDDRITKQ